MVVKLKIDQFTGGDMIFAVRSRRKARADPRFYGAGVSEIKRVIRGGTIVNPTSRIEKIATSDNIDMLNALNEMKKSRGTKLSDEYYDVKQEAEVDNLDDGEYIMEEIKEGNKEGIKEDVKQDIINEVKEEKPNSFLEALTAAYTRNAPSTDILKRQYKKKLPEITIDQKTLTDYFKTKPEPQPVQEKQKFLTLEDVRRKLKK